MNFPRRFLIGCLLAALVGSSCDCDDRIRRMVSNPGDRTEELDRAEKRRDPGESSAPTEDEPNDEPDRANALELGGELRPLGAEIDGTDDRDWFSLTTRDGESWQLELVVEPDGDSLDPVIRVEMSDADDDEYIEYDVAEAGEAETIPILGVSSRPQRIAVYGADDTRGEYEISFKKRLSGGDVETEPNDAPAAATRFEAPGELQGFYDRPDDRDIYYVPREDLDEEVFNFEVSGIDDLRQSVEVYTDEKLESSYLSFDVATATPAGLPNLHLPDDISGVWIVLTAGEDYERDESYRIKLLPHPSVDDRDVEAEPNGEFEQAQKIELGDRLAGYFHTPDDLDRFRMYVDGIPDEDDEDDEDEKKDDEEEDEEDERADRDDEEDSEDDEDARAAAERELEELDDPEAAERDRDEEQRPDPLDEIDDKEPPEHLVTVELAPERDEDRLSLAWTEDEEGDDLEEIRPDDDGEEAILCNQEVEEESLQLEVRQLDVERDDQGPTTTFDYKLDVVDVGEEEGMEIEPNDERDEADKLTADDPRTGYIARSNDVDVYAFGVPYPEEVDEEEASDEDEETDEEADSPFDFADGDSDGSQDGSQDADEPRAVDLSVSSHPLDLGFEVLDDEGGLVAEVDRSAPGGKESVGLDLPPGLYYVVVEADRGSSCEPYEVDVSFGDEE